MIDFLVCVLWKLIYFLDNLDNISKYSFMFCVLPNEYFFYFQVIQTCLLIQRVFGSMVGRSVVGGLVGKWLVVG